MGQQSAMKLKFEKMEVLLLREVQLALHELYIHIVFQTIRSVCTKTLKESATMLEQPIIKKVKTHRNYIAMIAEKTKGLHQPSVKNKHRLIDS